MSVADPSVRRRLALPGGHWVDVDQSVVMPPGWTIGDGITVRVTAADGSPGVIDALGAAAVYEAVERARLEWMAEVMGRLLDRKVTVAEVMRRLD